MSYIQPFDPWKSPLCTCPPKFSLNPYTGCAHACLYCYATSFIKNFYIPRIKKNFISQIKKEILKLPQNALVSLSNSSDPYQPLEKIYKHTRLFLNLIKNYRKDLRILIITKSSLVVEDLDILKELKCAVSITITSKNLAKILEPGAPPFEERIKALKILKKHGIPLSVRIDPVIPQINEYEVFEVFDAIKDLALHITVSSYKAKPDSLKRLYMAFPEKKEILKKLYLKEGVKISGSIYLSEKRRKNLIYPLLELAKKQGISFATCREGIKEFVNPGKCDGSFLIIA